MQKCALSWESMRKCAKSSEKILNKLLRGVRITMNKTTFSLFIVSLISDCTLLTLIS